MYHERQNTSVMLKELLDTGIAVYKAGLTDRMIMRGDHGRKDYAVEQGVPAEHIFMDHAGFSTYERHIPGEGNL